MYPLIPPCVSTMKTLFRLALALCLMASQASTKAFKLVSLPKLKSVSGTLLDSVAGRWIMGIWNEG
jgi:hypothetical protein